MPLLLLYSEANPEALDLSCEALHVAPGTSRLEILVIRAPVSAPERVF